MTERYEADGKYWEIEAKAKTKLVARWGKLGSSSLSTREYAYADAAATEKARAKMIAERIAKGFALVGGKPKKGAKAEKPKAAAPAAPRSNAKLEAQLADNPDDVATWLVYADWLQENGEPWGEVIAMAAAGKKPQKAQKDAAAAMLDGVDGASIKWKHGTIDTLELCPEEMVGDDVKMADAPMPRALARVLAHPAGRLVRHLVLGLPPTGDGDIDWSFDSIIPVIAKAGPLPLLQSIDMTRVAEHMDQDSWRRIGDLRGLWKAAPRLRELRMMGSNGSDGGKPIVLGDIEAPHLEKLVYISSGLDKSALRDLGRAKFPALRHLELYLGRRDYGCNGKVADLAGILAGKGLPKLEYLGLVNSEWEDGFVEAIAKSAIVKRIKTLDLSKGILYEEGAAALLNHAAAFNRLERLDLDENFLKPEDEKRIKKAIPAAALGGQREPDEYNGTLYRFCEVGE